MKRKRSSTPLIGRGAVLGFGLAIVGGWCLLVPMARERQAQAAWDVPSALSLRLLELGVAQRPRDEALRLKLARKQLEAGQLEAARANVLQLSRNVEVQELLLAIEYARWTATEPSDTADRGARLAELRATVAAVDVAHAPERLIERCAALDRELDQPARAAALLQELALRASGDAAERRLSEAESAWLASGLPLRAAELHAAFAGRGGVEGVEHARRALTLARAVDDASARDSLFERMRALFPRDTVLLQLGLRLTEERDVRHAFELAQQLSQLAPADANYHREVARLAEATGHGLRALDEYLWLWRREHLAHDRQRALELARQNWDLQLVRELLESEERTPRRRSHKGCQAADTRERFELYQALGDVSASRRLLDEAVAAEAAYDESTWRTKLSLELRDDDYPAALSTLTRALQRFGSSQLREQLVDLQLALGRPRDALATVLGTPASERSTRWLRSTAALAAAAGDIDSERSLYEELWRSPDATIADYTRLLALARDRASALQLAKAAARRYRSYEQLWLAIEIQRASGAGSNELALLEEFEDVPEIAGRSDYWRARIGLQQALTARAITGSRYAEAKRALPRAQLTLERAQRAAPDASAYAPLWEAQHAQELSIGLGSDDRALLTRAYAQAGEKLSARERVFVLAKLNQTERALQEARDALSRPDLQSDDRRVLQGDERSLSRGRERNMQAFGEAVNMPGLTYLGGAARVSYADETHAVRGEASYTQYGPKLAGDRLIINSQVREVAGWLRGEWHPLALEGGVSVRDAQPRPFGTVSVQFAGTRERGASASLMVNTITSDTARLRAFGTRDALALNVGMGFGEHLWSSARVLAEAFYTRDDRTLLGSGVTLDAAIGSSHTLPSDLGGLSVRAFGRVAPRFPETLPASQRDVRWMVASSEWAGVGLAIGRGQLDVPPLCGRQFMYIVDAGLGWLWPLSGVGYNAQARIGVSLAGGDLLSVSAGASNVVGSHGYSAQVGYALSFEH